MEAYPTMNEAAARAARNRSEGVGALSLLETSPFVSPITADGSAVSGGSHVPAVGFRLLVELVVHAAADVLVTGLVALAVLL
jgi:hypothetical protein